MSRSPPPDRPLQNHPHASCHFLRCGLGRSAVRGRKWSADCLSVSRGSARSEFGLRWQSAAATPLCFRPGLIGFSSGVCERKRRGAAGRRPAVRGKGRGPARKTPPSALHFPLVTQKKCDNSVSPAPPEVRSSRFIPGYFTPKRLYLRSLSAGAAWAAGWLKLVQKKLK